MLFVINYYNKFEAQRYSYFFISAKTFIFFSHKQSRISCVYNSFCICNQLFLQLLELLGVFNSKYHSIILYAKHHLQVKNFSE